MPINNILMKIDYYNDYIPLASSVTNLVDIFQKCVVIPILKKNNGTLNNYLSYLNDKKLLRCFILVIPFIGNIIVAIHDCSYKTVTTNDIEDIEIRTLERLPPRYVITVTLYDGRKASKNFDFVQAASILCNTENDKIGRQGKLIKEIFVPDSPNYIKEAEEIILPNPTIILTKMFKYN